MSYCKICIQNDKKKKRLFDLFTDKFKCEDEGRFLYRCKDCWQYSFGIIFICLYKQREMWQLLVQKMMSEGAQTAILHENICERAKKHINLVLSSCLLTNRIIVTSDHLNKSFTWIKRYDILTPRLHIISDTRIVF